jgi:pimeloyl-ACP methyl ester carboxylesterase
VSEAETPRHALIMLHGIYGRGRNWQTIARRVAEARRDYSCWLVDLPHHGNSPAGAHGDSVVGLSTDVVDWLRSENIPVRAILGHSYGGKVAIAMARALRDIPLQTWVIDSTPEAKAPTGSAWEMLEVVRRLPPRFASRDEAVAAIVSRGYAQGVAQWMTTNLVRRHDGFEWGIDFDAMERLLRDFFSTDLWQVIESAPPNHEFHFVKASQSSVLTPEAVGRLERVGDHVVVHHLEGGHWIHAESPQVVSALLIDRLSA